MSVHHPRRRLAVIPSAAALLAVLSSVAFASDPGSGKWEGKLKTNGADVSFKVNDSGKTLKTFVVVQLPVYCSVGGLTTRVFLVPSAKVKSSGKFNRVYKTRDHGEVDGKLKVSGHFKSAEKASGELNYVRSGCSSGPVGWSAKRKG